MKKPPVQPDSDVGPREIESPIPRRSAAQERELTQRLLAFPTLAARLEYLFDHESQYWLHKHDKSPEPDPAVIAAAPRRASPLVAKKATGPVIVEWVQARSGLTMNKQSLYNLRDGRNLTARPGIIRALAEFWRIDDRLLDPTIPASSFVDPVAEVRELSTVERRTYELMNEVGLVSVRPREVQATVQGSTDAEARQLLGVLEAIAQRRKSEQ